MRPDIKGEIAGFDEAGVKATHAPLPAGNAVIDEERPRDAQGAIQGAHSAAIPI
jgi:hypothetical protein